MLLLLQIFWRLLFRYHHHCRLPSAIRPDNALGLGIRCSFASSSNQYSILNASWRGNEVYSEIASAPSHHIDGIDIKLRGNPCGLFVFGKSEHSHCRINNHYRVCIANSGTIGMFAFFIIFRIHFSVRFELRLQVISSTLQHFRYRP